MPPKRKTTDTSTTEASMRTTRSSARSGKADASEEAEGKPTPRASKKVSKPTPASDEESDVEPKPKKAKTATTKSTSAKPKATKAAPVKATTKSANEKKSGEAKGNATVLPADAPVKSGSANPKSDDVRTVAPEPAKYEPYNAANAATLFARYADADDPSVIDPEGFERLCTDAGIPLDGAMPLLLAWQLDAKEEMAKIPRDAWVKGSEALHISSLPVLSLALNDLHALLIMNKHTPTPSIASSTNKRKKAADTAKSPYSRTRYSGYAADVKKTFASFYSFCFVLAKPESSRNIDMETAIALWSVILSPQYPLISDVITYINEAGTYKAVNKDLWAMMLEFCQTVQPDLQHYEADGAWPSLIDDFVTWKKARGGASASAVEQPVDIE